MPVCQNLSKFLSKLQLNETTWSHTWDQKKAKFLKVINNLIIYKFFKEFINHKKMTNRIVVFSCRCIPNILKHCDHSLNFPKIRRSRLIETQIEKVQFHRSSELPLEHNESQKLLSNQIWQWPYLTNLRVKGTSCSFSLPQH